MSWNRFEALLAFWHLSDNSQAPGPSHGEPPQKKQQTAPPMDYQWLQFPRFGHFLEEIPPTGKKSNPSKNCLCCTLFSGKRKEYLHQKTTPTSADCAKWHCVSPLVTWFTNLSNKWKNLMTEWENMMEVGAHLTQGFAFDWADILSFFLRWYSLFFLHATYTIVF